MAEIILKNGKLITLDDSFPDADALVIQKDRIVFVGESEGATQFQTPRTIVIDLKGKSLIPGFNDNHLHAVSMGDYFSKPHLHGLTADQIIEKLLETARDLKSDELIRAFGWDYPHCPNPHRSLLDRYFPDRPVVLFQYSGHAAWVNTHFLKKMKVTSKTADPPGGKIERDAAGKPTGILKDKATFPIHFKRILEMNLKKKLRADLIEKALTLFRENGITSVQDNTWVPLTVSHFNRLKKSGNLTARISCWSYGEMEWARFWLEHQRFDSSWVRKGPRKFFIDGTFSTRTAMLLEPYPDEPSYYGLPTITPKALYHSIQKGIRQKRQLALHAVGDGAIREFLNTLAHFKNQKQRIRTLRFRLEHAQLITHEDLKRLSDWGILVAAQPSALINLKKDNELIGEKRAKRAYPYRSFLNEGIPLSFGSDVPGESRFKPLELIHLAVNRNSNQNLTPLEALSAYTKGSAYAEFMEKEKGTLTPGKLADCVVLSEDLTQIPPEKIKEIQVEMTIAGGNIVFSKMPQ